MKATLRAEIRSSVHSHYNKSCALKSYISFILYYLRYPLKHCRWSFRFLPNPRPQNTAF